MVRGNIHWDYQDNSHRIKPEIRQAGFNGMKAVCLYIEGQAKLLAPVDMGDLRDGITHSIFTRGGNIEGVVGSPHEYAVYLEFGTGDFAENGAGRKGGWWYKKSGDPTKNDFFFTYGIKPRKFLRNAFRYSNMAAIQMLADEYGAHFK